MSEEHDESQFWPWMLGILAVLLWFTYFCIALSTQTPPWVPDWIQSFWTLPAGGEGSALVRRGQFGDAFGAFNALISTLAFVALLSTLRTQQRQLRAQRDQTRSEVRLISQQQFQEQYYRAVDAYRTLVAEFATGAPGIRSQSGADPLRGRSALFAVWNDYMLQPLANIGGPVGDAARLQLNAAGKVAGDGNNVLRQARRAIEELWTRCQQDDSLRQELLQTISSNWTTLYATYRFQLDSIFRAWYTVHRVLATAPNYRIDHPVARLYGASFRAQLSWIELTFLLVNQSGLPSLEHFPKACRHSNANAIFDNLAAEGDIAVYCLSEQAKARVADPVGASLNRSAFGS
jgi:hypothetical protein